MSNNIKNCKIRLVIVLILTVLAKTVDLKVITNLVSYFVLLQFIIPVT